MYQHKTYIVIKAKQTLKIEIFVKHGLKSLFNDKLVIYFLLGYHDICNILLT